VALIELQAVRKMFDAGQPNEFPAVRGVTLSIEAGKATCFKGPSGSGKTTLLSLIGCMARPTAGRIWLEGREITSLPERFLTDLRRRTFGFIFQQLNLIRGLSALENAMLPAYPLGRPRRAIRKRALELFEMFGLAERAHAKAQKLSGGEAQRLTIVRALMNDPAVIIADEATAHLDTALSLEFMNILGRLKGEGRTVLLASHDPLVYESPFIDRVVNLRDGLVEAGGDAA
jgi:putative ABC transport system ATP-binding protein